MLEHPGFRRVEGAETPEAVETGARVFRPVLVQSGNGPEPERLPVFRGEGEGTVDESGRLAVEAIAVRAAKRLGLGEKPADLFADRFRRRSGNGNRGRIEPAGLAEQEVETGREQRNGDPEDDGGAPARPCRAGRVAPLDASAAPRPSGSRSRSSERAMSSRASRPVAASSAEPSSPPSISARRAR